MNATARVLEGNFARPDGAPEPIALGPSRDRLRAAIATMARLRARSRLRPSR
jgi:hypothetical protein